MDRKALDFLREYSSDPLDIDRLLISSYLYINDIHQVNNALIRSYIIDRESADYPILLQTIDQNVVSSFEDLIQLFEFVISPSDKIVNGAIYTPSYIREYIVDQTLSQFAELEDIKVADISCGCGSFLLTLTEKIRDRTGKNYRDIFEENLFGVDITEYSIQRTKILLSLYSIANGEDEEQFNFNLFTGNSLTFNWGENCDAILLNDGFDLIVGNPPYVCSRNMDLITLNLIKEWEVANSGHPDLYIPFFQIGIENLNQNGLLGYITVNTFIKSINGRKLRGYFQEEDINLTLINFGGEQVFHDRNTYTCICFIRRGNGGIHYVRTLSTEMQNLDLNTLHQFNYGDLNHHDGWNLVNDQELSDFVTKIERVGTPFKSLYNTKNGIATLKNDIYKFTPTHHDANFYYFSANGVEHAIESGICRDIVNANKIKTHEDLDRLKEKIIFPYDENTRIIPEEELISKYPRTYAYLKLNRDILAKRDKGKGEEKYEAWYAYGRRQSMDINAFKLFFPHICERPTFVLCQEMDLLFYNGIAIVSNDLQKLLLIKKIMESDLFYKYIKNTTKDYASGYISMSRNYLKNFGIPLMTSEQQRYFLNSRNCEQLLSRYYALDDVPEIADTLIN